MGLFVLSLENSVQDKIEAAIGNIELYIQNPDCDYLIKDFAITQLKVALRMLEEIG